MQMITKAETDEQIQSCYKVMAQLRPHIKENEFLNKIRQQTENGYQLVYMLKDSVIVAVAGFHLGQNLAWGKYLYVEDLVTDQDLRSSGLGKRLLNWLHDEARKNNCEQLHLDSGVQRKGAHRFYEREGLTFASHHYLSKC